MISNPFFSVIIPTYNRADLIGKTIESVLSQELQDFEIIVVDDGSTDNTENVVSEIKTEKIRYYKKENAERGAARNAGVAVSLGKYITFLDSDDIFYSNHLSVVKFNLVERNYPEVYHQAYEVIDSANQTKKQFKVRGNINHILFTRGNIMSCMGVFVKREVAISFPFNPNRRLSGVEDWELWIRLASHYVIQYGNIVTSALVNHGNRSVVMANKEELVTKMDLLYRGVYIDKHVSKKYSIFESIFKANTYTYISLHLSENPKFKPDTLQYLVKGILRNAKVLLQKRTFAIIRNILFKW